MVHMKRMLDDLRSSSTLSFLVAIGDQRIEMSVFDHTIGAVMTNIEVPSHVYIIL